MDDKLTQEELNALADEYGLIPDEEVKERAEELTGYFENEENKKFGRELLNNLSDLGISGNDDKIAVLEDLRLRDVEPTTEEISASFKNVKGYEVTAPKIASDRYELKNRLGHAINKDSEAEVPEEREFMSREKMMSEMGQRVFSANKEEFIQKLQKGGAVPPLWKKAIEKNWSYETFQEEYKK